MWCGVCLRLIDAKFDHKECKHEAWVAISTQYTEAKELAMKQYDFAPKGATVDVRPPLTRPRSR
jgi:hypothetical protein